MHKNTAKPNQTIIPKTLLFCFGEKGSYSSEGDTVSIFLSPKQPGDNGQEASHNFFLLPYKGTDIKNNRTEETIKF